jgi:hypothetical protein
MTIAISMKVNDGIVLASDSAATIMGCLPNGTAGVINIYENANKVFNLYKGLPIGAITWGSGSIGPSSISSLAKDFRDLVVRDEKDAINRDNYTIEDIAKKFKNFIYDKHYSKEFKDWKEKPALGFMIVGYSSHQPLAEEWKIDIMGGNCNGPYIMRQQGEVGITWNGEIEAINRLYLGFSTQLPLVLKKAGLDDSKITDIINLCRNNLTVPMVMPPMPIQDAIDLAIYLVETTIRFARFAPGAPTVGGPIEVAAITKHEGFKWVRRKHYYEEKINPKLGDFK